MNPFFTFSWRNEDNTIRYMCEIDELSNAIEKYGRPTYVLLSTDPLGPIYRFKYEEKCALDKDNGYARQP